MKNDFNYKWSKLFASKRYNTKNGVIKLTPEEQQELLDDSETAVKNCSIPLVSSKDLFDMGLKYVLKIAEDEGKEKLHLDTAEMVARDYVKHVKHFLSCC